MAERVSGSRIASPAWSGGTQVVPPPAPASLSINDVTVTEGNAGTTVTTFVVSRSGDSSEQVTVAYSTADDSAIAGVDYLAASGELTFAAGETSTRITVVVNGDRLGELNETFNVHLSGATIADALGVGTVLDDDAVAIPLLGIAFGSHQLIEAKGIFRVL